MTVVVTGLGVSAGKVVGPARIVRGPADFGRVRPRDVLVCRTSTPAMIAVLLRVAAIVADTGGICSHPAIVARELGIPCVVGTQQATKLLVDGQLVVVDGTDGTIVVAD